MRCMLLGNLTYAEWSCPWHKGLSYNQRFINKEMRALEKLVWREKTRLTTPEVPATKTRPYVFRQSLLFFSSIKKKTKGGSARRVFLQLILQTFSLISGLLHNTKCDEGFCGLHYTVH